MFKIRRKKSPKWVTEHRDGKKHNGQCKANLVRQLRWVVAMGFIGHVVHLFEWNRSPHLKILRLGVETG